MLHTRSPTCDHMQDDLRTGVDSVKQSVRSSSAVSSLARQVQRSLMPPHMPACARHIECFRTLTSLAAAGIHDPEAALETYTMWCPVSVSEVPLPVDKTQNDPGFAMSR